MSRTPDAILSIQSAVASGHVGNSAAVLPLQRLGFDVFPVYTVLLAHHPGQGRGWRGHKVEPARIAEILSGLEASRSAPTTEVGRRSGATTGGRPWEPADGSQGSGAFGRCVAVLSGYFGAPEVADLVLRAVESVRAVRPDALFLCDPVIGDDHTGVFVAPGVAEAIRDRLLPAADMITPNRFELGHLSGGPADGIDAVLAAAAALRATGPRLVVATGLELPDAPGTLSVLADAADAGWLVTTPRVPGLVHGTGDLFSALFLGHYLRTREVKAALELASAATFAVVERTQAAGTEELQLVAAQNQLAAPDRRFVAVRLR
jgi:pyridoxine kinase